MSALINDAQKSNGPLADLRSEIAILKRAGSSEPGQGV